MANMGRHVCYKCVQRIYALRKKLVPVTFEKAVKSARDTDALWTSYNANLDIQDCPVCEKFQKQTLRCIKLLPQPEEEEHSCLPEHTRPIEQNKQAGPSSILEDCNYLPPVTAADCLNISQHTPRQGMSMTDTFTDSIADTDPPINPSPLTPTFMITNTPTLSLPRATSTPKSNKTCKTLTDSSTSPMFKQTITVESILKQPVTEPLTQHEEELATHITRRKLYTSDEKGKITFKTRGQPLTFHRVSVHRKSSNVASSPT
ncbi:hypothetical protein PoB_001216700 [Plakobranchus ocellatus]|uniref:Uncharacterized protein n=1 Tax=Plakobranchus ocellatus TaxID=259542 RepID=A0AAV3YT81_9GAST|nr:hypothetical protein PoB_001216700 [Plakobranchus ocellatus]